MNENNQSREDKALVLALLRSSQCFFRAMNPVFQDVGLTSSQWDVLETLHTKGELSINELMRLILSTSGNLDVVVKNLMQAGLVEKTVDENDRRSRRVRLTRLGRREVEHFLPIHKSALADLFGGLTSGEKRNTIRSLNHLRKQLERRSQGDEE